MTKKLAVHGWMFRVGTSEAASQPAVIYFAVGKNSLQEAMAAALDHPDIEPGDEVAWADRLTSIEIRSFRLRPDEVRTYGKRAPKAPWARLVFQRQVLETFAPLPIFSRCRFEEECDAQEEKMD